jgi:acetate kinase
VRVLGPARETDQVELSRSDEIALGIPAPLRISGDLEATPGIDVVGPAGKVRLPKGVITAARHLHMTPADAQSFDLREQDKVSVRIDSDGRDTVFADVAVRVSAHFRLELHLDTDEGNAAGVCRDAKAYLLLPGRS